MGHFPFFMEIEGKTGVIVGGGKVAARKAEKLLHFGANLKIVSPCMEQSMQKLLECSDGRVQLIMRRAETTDLETADFVIAATDDIEINRAAAEYCKEHGILVNVANGPEEGNFYFPGLVTEGDVTIGISTGGKSPAASAFLRKEIEKHIPEGIGKTIELLGQLRPEMQQRIGAQSERARAWEALFSYCIANKGSVTEEELREQLNMWDNREKNRAEEKKQMKKIRIGTRGSRLALVQAEMTQAAIRKAAPDTETELVILHTKGDKILDRPFAQIGDKGLFVSEFEEALLEDRIDIAVHSAKDLPMKLADGLTIAAVLPRADVRDVLVVKNGNPMPVPAEAAETPEKKYVIGTTSQRRCAQAEKLWKNIETSPARGNVETRLRKLEEGQYDAILLAKAGLDRLGIDENSHPQFTFHPLAQEKFLPAACQGIVAIEAKEGGEAAELVAAISHLETEFAFQIERTVLDCLQADCSEPAGAWCRVADGVIALDVMYGNNRCEESCRAEECRAAADCQTEETGRIQENGGAEDRDKMLEAGMKMAQKAAEKVRA